MLATHRKNLLAKSTNLNFLSRRSAMGVIFAAPVWATLGSKQASAQIDDLTARILVDTLIPRDQSPSASDLRIHHKLLQLSNTIPNYSELLQQGLAWIDELAKYRLASSFINLPPTLRLDVLKIAADQATMTLPQVFASRVRNDTLALYYADPRSWVGLYIDGPIQPYGYTDHSQPPGR